MQGTVKKVIFDRGYGFIRAENGEEVFFHRSAIVEGDFDFIREGQDVSFELEQSPRGMRAKDVKVAK